MVWYNKTELNFLKVYHIEDIVRISNIKRIISASITDYIIVISKIMASVSNSLITVTTILIKYCIKL